MSIFSGIHKQITARSSSHLSQTVHIKTLAYISQTKTFVTKNLPILDGKQSISKPIAIMKLWCMVSLLIFILKKNHCIREKKKQASNAEGDCEGKFTKRNLVQLCSFFLVCPALPSFYISVFQFSLPSISLYLSYIAFQHRLFFFSLVNEYDEMVMCSFFRRQGTCFVP